jgi:hypothetical protein
MHNRVQVNISACFSYRGLPLMDTAFVTQLDYPLYHQAETCPANRCVCVVTSACSLVGQSAIGLLECYGLPSLTAICSMAT